MPLLQPRESKQQPRKRPARSSADVAPIYDDDGLPYNYIVVIDAGSKGSRAYVYAWESTKYHLAKGEGSDPTVSPLAMPRLVYKKHWHKRIKPSIESSIIEFGLHNSYLYNYLDHLIAKIYGLVPIEQHSRTPILFHATAGLRALDPNLQSKILDKICVYFKEHTDFYFPDCASHVNILDGDVEGLYSWITLNYLINDNRWLGDSASSSYGVLELGGGSAQICFQPSPEETDKHSVQLVNLQLDRNYQLFSTSFLGYGLNQFHHDYLLHLIQAYTTSAADPAVAADADATASTLDGGAYKSSHYGYSPQILDPCLPKDYSNSFTFNNHQYILQGSSNFQQCLTNIYLVIGDNDEECRSLFTSSDNAGDSNPIKVSKCMLTSIMPKFSLDKDNFIAISGYWDAVTQLLDFTGQQKDTVVSNSVVYHPEIFTPTTEKICNMDFSQLLEYKSSENGDRFSHNEISNLCFKSSYISALLHSGYGLPLDTATDLDLDSSVESASSNVTNHLLLNDKINDFKFSWTLGRAFLYAADESAREYAAFVNGTSANLPPELRVGYYRNSAPTLFNHGSEQKGIPPRPDFELKDEYATFTFDIKNTATKGAAAKSHATTTDEAMDYYYDFDNGYDDDDDNNFDDNDDFGANGGDDEDETELFYQTSHHSTALKVVPIIILITVLLHLLPWSRNVLFRLYKKIRLSFSSYRKLSQYPNDIPTQSSTQNAARMDRSLRKFHIRGNNKKNTDVHYDGNSSNDQFNTYSNTASAFPNEVSTSGSTDLELQDFKANYTSDHTGNNAYINNSSVHDGVNRWEVDDNLRNDVVSDYEFDISDNDWDNDSDGIERAA